MPPRVSWRTLPTLPTTPIVTVPPSGVVSERRRPEASRWKVLVCAPCETDASAPPTSHAYEVTSPVGSVTWTIRPKPSRRVVVSGFRPPAPHVACCRFANAALTQYVLARSATSLYGCPASDRSNVARLECFEPTTCCGRPNGSWQSRSVPGADAARAVGHAGDDAK